MSYQPYKRQTITNQSLSVATVVLAVVVVIDILFGVMGEDMKAEVKRDRWWV